MTATQFGKAYTEGFHRTLCFLSSKGLPDAEAEEIAQAAWTRGWERRDQLRDEAMVSTWVNSIAFNLFRNQYRRNARHTELPEIPDSRPSSAPARSDLRSLLGRCERIDRTLLWMQYGEGRTSAEIAGWVGMKPATVRIRIMRAKGRLRRFCKSRRLQLPTPLQPETAFAT
jgi:RNA polymerase sigma-70 factor (ECF subfamily)